jgi:hypothetical protein
VAALFYSYYRYSRLSAWLACTSSLAKLLSTKIIYCSYTVKDIFAIVFVIEVVLTITKAGLHVGTVVNNDCTGLSRVGLPDRKCHTRRRFQPGRIRLPSKGLNLFSQEQFHFSATRWAKAGSEIFCTFLRTRINLEDNTSSCSSYPLGNSNFDQKGATNQSLSLLSVVSSCKLY